VAKPSVTAVSPNTEVDGGPDVIITGTGFTGATAVFFGSQPTAYTVISPTEIAATPIGLAGAKVSVSVTTSGGTGSLANAFTFAAAAFAPYVSALDPGDGPAGTTVTILGYDFSGATAVHFGSAAATSFKVLTDNEITAVAPAGTTGLEVDVTVTTKLGTSIKTNADFWGYHVTAKTAAPYVSVVEPATGPASGGEAVLVLGPSFSGVTGVKFGPRAAASFKVLTDSSILAITPPGAAGTTVDVTVSSAAGTSVTSHYDEFTYAQLPTVTKVNPPSGSTVGGLTMMITGTGFTSLGSSCLVDFGISDCATIYHIVSPTEITAVTPVGVPGTFDVRVTTANGTSFGGAADKFTFVEPKPTVTNVGPPSGPTAGGTLVGLTGTGFTKATKVSFGGVAAKSFTVYSDVYLVVTDPSHGAGTVDVTVTNPVGTSAASASDKFTYEAAPSITSVSPAGGPQSGGTGVIIMGTGFVGVGNVSFGLNPTQFTVLSATKISAVSPAGPAGVVDVQVTTPGGTSAKSVKDKFTYSAGPPTVSGLSPGIGSTGGTTTVQISGTGFGASSTVLFGTTKATVVALGSSTGLFVTAPKHALGTVTVTVTNASGTSSDVALLDKFTYVAAPTVTNVSVNSGPTTGGSTVTITGTGFVGVTSVSFGTGPYGESPTYDVASATSITAVVPSQAAGVVGVVVTAAGGTSAPATGDHYTYTPAVASVTLVSPNAGPTVGGVASAGAASPGQDVINVYGAGFANATAVKFGGVAGHFRVESPNFMEVTPPPEPDATVDITVVDTAGTSRTSGADEYTYLAPAKVTSVSPNSGPTAGGETVLVTGSGFSNCRLNGYCTVNFGSQAREGLVLSDTEISVSAPSGALGVVNVSVTTVAGTSPVVAGDRFTYTPAATPTISEIFPSSGPTTGGTDVSIFGSGFSSATAVYFGTKAAAGFAPESDGTIMAIAPAGTGAAGTGIVAITVQNTTGKSATTPADQFTYKSSPTVTVTKLTPSSGPSSGGTTVTITGTNLTSVDYVNIGNRFASPTPNLAGTSLTFVTPAEAPFTVPVSLDVGPFGAILVPAGTFTYVPSRPVVSDISPSAGPPAGGVSVFISGTGFSAATSVMFGSVASQSFTVGADGTYIEAIAPAGTVDTTVAITVTNKVGTSALVAADHFEYLAGPPTVSKVSTHSGPASGGTLVTITGTDFSNVTSVAFGPYYVSYDQFTVNSPTSITAISPPGNVGTVDVTVSSLIASSATSSADEFTYTAVAPVVESVSPAVGPSVGGTAVRISGSGFYGASAVRFGSAEAIDFSVSLYGGITAVAPPGSGTVDITVTTPAGTSATSPADQFTYIPPPTVSSLNVTSGSTAGGTSVTITGTNFADVSSVSFGLFPASVDSVSATSIMVTTPPEAPGTIDVTVTTPGGTSATLAADHFTFVAAMPVVTRAGPSEGPTAGGQVVDIIGSSFSGATKVKFGGVQGIIESVGYEGTNLTAIDPAEAAGTVDVRVTTPVGTSVTTPADQFTYVAAPTLSKLSVTSGPTAGGTSVTITGTNLSSSSVYFGTEAASIVTPGSTSLTVTSPAEASGVVDVTVTTAGGTSGTSSADKFTYVLVDPVVTGLFPTSGSTLGGDYVEVDGTSFFGVTGVTFGGTPAEIENVGAAGNYLDVLSPPHGAGVVDVRVTTTKGESAIAAADKFTYVAPPAPPVVTSLSVSKGSTAGGTIVTINGTGLASAYWVQFGQAYVYSSSFTSNTATAITLKSPPNTALPVDVQVTTGAGTSATSPADVFTYQAAAPIVTEIYPTSGSTAGGTSVSITGVNLFAVTAVDFGSTAGTVSSFAAPSGLTVTSPPGAGTVHVTVVTAMGTSAKVTADQFTYIPPPAVTKVSPNTDTTAGGMTVTITGTNLENASSVQFGSVEEFPSTDTASSITVIDPPQAAGTVDVAVTTPGGTSAIVTAGHFTYTAVPPTVTFVSPTDGSTLGGTQVEVGGASFFGVTHVYFGSTAGTVTYVSSDGTYLDVTSPAEGAGPPVDVRVVVSPGGESAVNAPADQFTYGPPPVVTKVTPSSGSAAGGTPVTITGTGLTGADYVQFGSFNYATPITNTDTQITVDAPAGTAGAVDVLVTTAFGTSAISVNDKFTYT